MLIVEGEYINDVCIMEMDCVGFYDNTCQAYQYYYDKYYNPETDLYWSFKECSKDHTGPAAYQVYNFRYDENIMTKIFFDQDGQMIGFWKKLPYYNLCCSGEPAHIGAYGITDDCVTYSLREPDPLTPPPPAPPCGCTTANPSGSAALLALLLLLRRR